LPELPNGYAGEETALRIVSTLVTYDLVGRLGMITGDNASSNDTMCRAVERILLEQHSVQWSALHHRARCQAHIVNIATQAFMFAHDNEAFDVAVQRSQNTAESGDLMDEIATLAGLQEGGFCRHQSMTKAYGLALELRTMKYHNAFKKLAGRVIRLPNKTRWNGWYFLLLETGQCRPYIAQLLDQYPELDRLRLTAVDWEVLDATKRFLQPFYDLTIKLEGKQVTLDKVQESIEALIMHYKESEIRHAGNPGLLAAINTS